jgi:acyl-CoA synthetase (AMP-forming)/AMP-acid ligase II/uncharacterized protein YhhL (DUF1145 family)
MTRTSADVRGMAGRLRANARDFPEKKAVVFAAGTAADGRPAYRHKTYRDVDRESDAYAAGFHRIGITAGTKTVLMLRPGPEFYSVVFGLFKAGAVPVVVDPGMGVRRMLHCYRSVGAEAFVGIPVAHLIRVLSPRTFGSLRTHVTAGRRWLWRGHSLRALAATGSPPPRVTPADDDLALIGFTTGSTGPAKGVESTHGMFDATVRQVVQAHGLGSEDTSLVTLPAMGLLDLLTGATCVLPPVDPTKVADADPQTVVDAIERFGVTTMFASPALLSRLGRYAADTGLRLPTLRRLVSGGAPVSAEIVASLHEVLGGGEHERFHTTYGATEVLQISSISSAEILGETRGRTRTGSGTCVGRPVPGIEVRLVRITDEPIPVWSDDLLVAPGEVGEITVSGPTVSRRYHASPTADAAGKIADGERVWHRTGDLGWVEDGGRIWFCGRKSHRVFTAEGPRYTVQCEQILGAHPDVYRTALVGVGPRDHRRLQQPVICVELREGVPAGEHARVERELREMAARHPLTRNVKAVLFHPRFPVDIRHNAKINREVLAEWAAGRLEPGGPPPGRALLLRAVPVAGWAFLLYGLIWPFDHPVLRALLWIDAFLSVVVHGLQLPIALPRARRAGYSVARSVFLTFLFGATWWKQIRPAVPSATTGESS